MYLHVQKNSGYDTETYGEGIESTHPEIYSYLNPTRLLNYCCSVVQFYPFRLWIYGGSITRYQFLHWLSQKKVFLHQF